MLLKLIIWGLLIYLVYRAAKSRISGPRESGGSHTMDHPDASQVDDIMIQDPMCGIYFPKREGIVYRHEGRDIHFCSTKCRDQFIAEHEGEK